MQMPRFAIVLLLLSALLLTACPSPTPPVAPLDITTFSADPLTIKLGDSSTLLWAVTGEDVTLRISDGVGNVTGVSETVSPTETTEYTLTATNSAGSDTATARVVVNAPPFIESSFDGVVDEGWTINRAIPSNPGEGGSGGGSDNGYITSTPATNGLTSYYIAPLKYRTSWLEYGEISFDIFSSGGEYYTGAEAPKGDVYLANGSLTARRLLPKRPDTEWETFVIPLEDEGWIFSGGATLLSDILERVTSFQIRAEYGSGADVSGLDNVRVGPSD